jgi:ACS family sodium-dependent inorganic phosphate cotransporter
MSSATLDCHRSNLFSHTLHAPPPPPLHPGALLGITNTAGAIPGVLGVTAAGYLLDATNSWALALFYPTALCQLFGAVFYTLFASSEKQSWS